MSDDKKPISKAPPPIKPLRGGGYVSIAKLKTITPDWDEWKHVPDVNFLEACALSMNIDPHSLVYERFEYQYEPDTEDEAVKKEFAKRLRILSKCAYKPPFSANATGEVRLDEFATWISEVVKWDGVPLELLALTKSPAKQASHSTEVNVTEANESIPNTPALDGEPDEGKILADLFEPVTVAELEKMFPAKGKWRRWAERAKANKLVEARVKRGMFNPYHAAMWFLKRGIEGWELARCYRALANNLPARSRDKANLLTGHLD